jgi:ATP-dependent Zn protease
MTLKSGQSYNGIYECMVNLSNGSHSYYFTASDGLKTVKTDDFNLDNTEKVEKTTDKKQSSNWSILIIITIIIILMILFLIVRRKRFKQREKEILAKAPTTPTVQTVATSQPIIDTPTVIPSVIPTTSPEPQIDIEQPKQQLLENKEKE